MSPGLDDASTNLRRSSSGFCVGWGSLFAHAVAGGWDVHHIFGFRALWVWNPIFPFLAISVFSVLTCFSLGMTWVFQRVRAIGNSHIVNVEREIFAFAKMDNALMGPPQSPPRLALFL